ncbi:MAG: hypothetical protein AB7G80_09560 [Dongiaceae bacterium]
MTKDLREAALQGILGRSCIEPGLRDPLEARRLALSLDRGRFAREAAILNAIAGKRTK